MTINVIIISKERDRILLCIHTRSGVDHTHYPVTSSKYFGGILLYWYYSTNKFDQIIIFPGIELMIRLIDSITVNSIIDNPKTHFSISQTTDSIAKRLINCGIRWGQAGENNGFLNIDHGKTIHHGRFLNAVSIFTLFITPSSEWNLIFL